MAVRQSDIAERLVQITSALTGVPPLAAYVEEVDNVPYCCYQIESDTARYCKSGLCGWDSGVSIYIVSDSETEASGIKDSIIDAIEAARSATFFPKITSITPAYEEGQWMYKISYEFITLI